MNIKMGRKLQNEPKTPTLLLDYSIIKMLLTPSLKLFQVYISPRIHEIWCNIRKVPGG